MTKLTVMSDIIQCFKIIEKKIPYVVFNDDVDLQRQLDFFLNICKNDLGSCPSVKVIFPMFYKLENWKEFSTLLINTDKYLSRYPGFNFNNLITKQLDISNKDKSYSFTQNILEKQNKTGNKDRYNVIISGRGNDKFKIIENKNMIFYFSTPYFHTIEENDFQIINYNVISYNEELGFKIPTIPPKIDAILKPLFQPAFIHTLYLKKNQKIYYIFSNSVSKYKENTTEVETTYGLGGLFVLMEDIFKTSPKKEKELIEVLERITDKVSNRIINFYQVSIIKLQATRAAISQVMARNMSHNIGSHVLSKLLKDDQIKQIFFKNKGKDDGDKVQNLDDINAILTNNKLFYQCLNALKDIDIKKNDEICTPSESDKKEKETNESLLAYFFDYLKARMDFLADVTTSTPVMENAKGLYNDMVKPFIKNRVLNDRISGLDKFYYKITVCKPDSTKNNGNSCESVTEKTKCSYRVDDINSNHNDIQLSIPNDVLGVQAFYTILENIIRNTAKHGTKPFKKEKQNGSEVGVEMPFEFTIKVEDALQKFADYQNYNSKTDLHLDEYYCISIFDNCDLNTETEINLSEYTTEDDKKKTEIYEAKTIEEVKKNRIIKIKKVDKLVIDQNFILNKSILEDNQLRHGGWGLIEMDASAAYLRKIDVELIDSDEYSITDFYGVSPVTEDNQLCIYQAYAEQDKYLGYRFFIRKPQEILIVGDVNQILSSCKKESSESDTTKQLNELKNKGIWIKSEDEIEKAIKKNTIFPHRLIVIDKAYTELLPTIQNNPQFSRRILKDLCAAKIRILLSCDIPNKLDQNIKQLWQYYYTSETFKKYDNSNGNKGSKYDSHGQYYISYVEDGYNFVEICFSATKHFFIVSSKFPQKELNMDYSWPLNIVVIDERIQYFAKYGKYAFQNLCIGNTCAAVENGNNTNCRHDNRVPYSMLYKKTNILVPEMESDCNLNEQNFSNKTNGEEQYDKIIKYIKNNFVTAVLSQKPNTINIEKTEFLVIHLGIIEKLITAWNNKKAGTTYDKENKDKVGEFIRDKILKSSDGNSITDEVLNSLYNRVIVTSGRGKPHNLPDDIRYLNFSVISQYMVTQRNKFAFTEALYSARKTN